MIMRTWQLAATADPVRTLAALGAVYQANAIAAPALYRTMFEASAELEDPVAAAASSQVLVDAVLRGATADRFAASTDASAAATRYWAAGTAWHRW